MANGANGTSFDIDLGVAGVTSYETAAAALDRIAASLDTAGSAAAKAAEDLRAGEASYNAAEAAANRAAKALENVNLKLDEQRERLAAAQAAGDESAAARAAAKIEELTAKQAKAAATVEKTKAALEAEAAALDKLRAASTAADEVKSKLEAQQKAVKKVVDAFEDAQKAARGTGNVKDMAEGFSKLGGALGPVGGKLAGVIDGFSKLGASAGVAVGAIAGVVIVIGALSVALGGAVIALTKFAVANSDAARTSELLSAGIAGSVEGGAELEDTINALAKRVPKSRDELRKMAADLKRTGFSGKELAAELEAAAERAAEAEFGPEWAKEMKSLSRLADRFKNNLSGIFKLNIEPLLDALSGLVDLFDETSVTGQAMKTVFQDVFQKIIDAVVELQPKIVAAFIQIQIWILRALIAIKPFGSTIVGVAKVIGVALLAVGAAIAAAIGYVLAMGAATSALITGLVYLGKVVFDTGKKIVDYLANLSLEQLGTDLIDGLIAGITKGAAAVVDSIKGVVGGAIDAAKGLLGIASPSKVFAEIGEQTAAGMSGGVEDGTRGVQSAIETMVSPPVDAGAAEGDAGAGGSTFQITINAPSGDAEEIGAVVRRVITELLEGDATELMTEVPA